MPPSTPSPIQKKSFRCTFCNREFRRLEHLQRHTRTHTNEKPFSCSCGALFTRQDLLRRHERIAHSASGNSASPSTTQSQLTENLTSTPLDQSNFEATTAGIESRATSIHPFSNDVRSGPSQINVPDESTRNQSTTLRNHFIELEQLIWEEASRSGDRVYQARNVQSNVERPSSPEETEIRINIPLQIPAIQPSLNEGTNGGQTAKELLPTRFPIPTSSLGRQVVPYLAPPVVSELQRNGLLQSLSSFRNVIPDFNLPSRDSLTRFLAGYFIGFYPHTPCTHPATFKVEDCSPELFLSMMAIGAFYRYEFKSAIKLFYTSKAILMEHRRRKDLDSMKRLTDSGRNDTSGRDIVDDIRCLLCLITFATWQKDSDLKNESFMLQSLLAHSVRLSGLAELAPNSRHLDWETWAQQESARRSKLFAFCFLNIQSMTYDLPPVLMSDEIDLRLPCSCPEWTAPDAISWNMLRQNFFGDQDCFQTALKSLLCSTAQARNDDNITSPVANYVLLHAVIQKITWSQRATLLNLGLISINDHQAVLQTALHRWTTSWQRTPESNLEPLDPNGPLSFTSCALLGLSYIRICFNLGRSQALLSWDSSNIASLLHKSQVSCRDWNMLLAALHSANLLDIMTKLGIQYINHNQAFVWGIEEALCGFECALFLSKWLLYIEQTIDQNPLSEHENLLIHWLQTIIQEGLASINGDFTEPIAQFDYRYLAFQVVNIWSHIMRGTSPWSFINMLGDTLVAYMDKEVEMAVSSAGSLD